MLATESNLPEEFDVSNEFARETTLPLAPGDLIEIKYRLSRESGGEREVFDRWLAAEVVYCDAGMWPLVRLNDGQLTEVRRFMEWRFVPGHRRRVAA